MMKAIQIAHPRMEASNQPESNTNDSEENIPGNTHTMDDDEISIKNGSPEDP